MKNYQHFINPIIRDKYSESTIFKYKFLFIILRKREESLKKFLKKSTMLKKNYKKKDFIYLELKKIYKKSYLNNLHEKKIIKYYKMFNIYLRLLCPNKNETSAMSYLYLGAILLKLKEINKLQKINIILKILDKIITSKKYFFDQDEKNIFATLISYEKKCIEKLIYQ